MGRKPMENRTAKEATILMLTSDTAGKLRKASLKTEETMSSIAERGIRRELDG